MRARVRSGRPSHWVGYSKVIQRRPWTALIAGTLVIVALAVPLKDFRLGFPDAGNDPAGTMTRQAYDLVAAGFGPGASGPLMLTAELPRGGGDPQRALTLLRERVAAQPQVQSAAPAQLNRTRDAAVLMAIPRSSPQQKATQALVDDLRADVLPAVERVDGHDRQRRRHDGGDRRPGRVHARPPAAVHRRGRVAVVPAAAGGVPLAAGRDQGRAC